jgi:hypothetical protein
MFDAVIVYLVLLFLGLSFNIGAHRKNFKYWI